MAVVTRFVDVPPSAVFAVLADTGKYGEWVVGTSDTHRQDAGWPAVGSRIGYKIRMGPVKIGDQTVVRAVEPGRMLELEAHAPPFGAARIRIELRPAAAGTEILIDEHPQAGVGRWLHNPVFDALIARRNREALRRLARLAVAHQLGRDARPA